MIWETLNDYESLSERAAGILLDTITSNPRTVLGLPTGRSPIGMYQRVVAECRTQYRCFRDVTTFNLDEYVGIPRTHPASYYSFMKHHFFDHVDLEPSRTLIPDGNAPTLAGECARYERLIREAGQLALTFLGLGRNGHIGFNEPGTSFDSRTRVVDLADSTRKANTPYFPDGIVPPQAITMGIATILESKRIVLLVSGSGKTEAIQRLRSRDQEPSFPASALWKHPDVLVLLAP